MFFTKIRGWGFPRLPFTQKAAGEIRGDRVPRFLVTTVAMLGIVIMSFILFSNEGGVRPS